MKRKLTQRDKAEAYDALRDRVSRLGFACVGYALDSLERR
jgi:hypothetical protein